MSFVQAFTRLLMHEEGLLEPTIKEKHQAYARCQMDKDNDRQKLVTAPIMGQMYHDTLKR